MVSTPAEAQSEASISATDCVPYEGPVRRRPGRPVPEIQYCDDPGLRPAVWDDLPDFAAIRLLVRMHTSQSFHAAGVSPITIYTIYRVFRRTSCVSLEFVAPTGGGRAFMKMCLELEF